MKISNSYITVPAYTFHNLSCPVSPPKKAVKTFQIKRAPSCWFFLLTAFVCLSTFNFMFTWHATDIFSDSMWETYSTAINDAGTLKPLLSYRFDSNFTENDNVFWKQPDGMGYEPCLDFSRDYEKISPTPSYRKRKFLIVVVAGGLNQQRNQIVDAVVIARILGVVLVVPVLQVNQVWGDDSEFSDIFDINHFKQTLSEDVAVVANLPSSHIMSNPGIVKNTPANASPEWIRQHYLNRFNDGVLVLRGLVSRLSKNLPADLQKLRCKVNFQALRFTSPIQAFGDLLARRMALQGPYVALHLRLEKDVWIRTGCSAGLGASYDEEVRIERLAKPKLLTAKSNLSYEDRRMAGRCPLNAKELARFLKALGATELTRIYWAGGKPLGGEKALRPLVGQFPFLYHKETLALPQELLPFKRKASILAAIDYVVCLNSHVFIPSHGGNMGRLLRGNREFAGHRKTVIPNKRLMLPLFANSTLSPAQFDQQIREMHESSHQPVLRTDKEGLDVISHPIPECMCTRIHKLNSSRRSTEFQD